jgi:hypothetical protein
MSSFSNGLLRSKVGSFTRDMTAASGAVAYTGVGFKPRAILFLGSISGTTLGSEGFSDSSGAGKAIASWGAAMIRGAGGAICILLPGDTSLLSSQSAVIASLDADGFTLTWTKSSTPGANNADVYYLALG